MPNTRKPRTFIPSKYTLYTVHSLKIHNFRILVARPTMFHILLVVVHVDIISTVFFTVYLVHIHYCEMFVFVTDGR